MFQKSLMVLLFSLFAPAAFGQGATDASVDRLFVAMQVQRSLDSIYPMMQSMMKQGMSQALPAEATPAQREAAGASAKAFEDVMREELSWQRLKPDMIRTYADTFTEAEVLGAIAFYESPAGQAFVEKTPQLMQKSMAMSQQRMNALIPRMKAAVEKAALDARAAAAR